MSGRPRRAPTPAVVIDVSIGDLAWGDGAALEALVARTVQAAITVVPLHPAPGAELSVLFTDDRQMRMLNGRWRNKDAPTNVLSFPAPLPGGVLGDIVLARETVAAEAAAEGKTIDAHVAHLVLHGFLHLFGFDHGTAAAAARMEATERRVLAALGIPDPYDGD
jgi:probable rRNA maturation factor